MASHVSESRDLSKAAVSPLVDKRSRAGRFLRRALGFWRGEAWGRAWFFSTAFLTFLLVNVGVALAINRWNKYFFDALEIQGHRQNLGQRRHHHGSRTIWAPLWLSLECIYACVFN